MIPDFVRSLMWVSLTGGIFILAATLVRTGMKNRLPKHFLVLLWAAVLLHLLFLLGAPSPTSIYNYVHFSSPVDLEEAVAYLPVRGADASQAGPAAGAQAVPESADDGAWRVVFHVWLAGSVVFAILFAGSFWRTFARFRTAFLLKGHPVVERWRAARGRPPRVYLSDRTATPLALGVFRPRIVLPSGFDLDNAALVESVLEHEYVHSRHYHNAVKILVGVAAILHWFNPLVWLYWFLFAHDLELACDERVIRRIGPGRRAEYAHSLVAVAEKAAFPVPLVSAFSARSLKERIVDVMGYKRTTGALLLAEVALVAVLFALFGTVPVTASGVPDPTTGRPAAPGAEFAEAVFPPDADPLAAAMAIAGGGVLVKQEAETKRGRTVYEYRIVSGDFEYSLKLDPVERAVVKYERKAVKKPFAGLDASRFIGMEQALREGLAAAPDASAVGCELRHVKPDRFMYKVKARAQSTRYEIDVDAVAGGVLNVLSEPARPRKSKP